MASKEKKQPAEHSDSTRSELGRRFRAHPVLFVGTVVILVFTIVAFVFVPAMAPKAGPGDGGKLTFGSYAGKPIDFVAGNYFASQRDYYNQQIRSSGSDQNLQFAAFQVWRAAFESTVLRTAVLTEMDAAGFRLPEDLVDRKMAEHPAFQEEGRFSAVKFRSMSDSDRMTLRNNLRDELIVARYTEDLVDLQISTKETEFMKSMASPERSFEFVSFPLSSFPDSEVSVFVAAQKDLFKTIRLSSITLTGKEADAKKVLESVKKDPSTFAETAKKQSKDDFADKGGEMGAHYAYELKTIITDESARNSILSSQKGSISDLVKVANGWAIYKCDEAAQDAAVNDAATLAKAREYLMTFERGKIEDSLIAKAASFTDIARSRGMSAASAQFGVSVKKFGPIGLNYGDVELYRSLASLKVQELARASTSEAFWNAAFATKPAEIAKPVVVGDSVVVLRVVEERNADDSALAVINYYYPYAVGQYSDKTLKNHFLGSKKLQDKFYETFIKYFMPQ